MRARVFLTDPLTPSRYSHVDPAIPTPRHDINHSIDIFAAQHVSLEAIARVAYILVQMSQDMHPDVLKQTLQTMAATPHEPGLGAGVYIIGANELAGSAGLAELESALGVFARNGRSQGSAAQLIGAGKPFVLLNEKTILGHVDNPALSDPKTAGQVSVVVSSYGTDGHGAGDASMSVTVHEFGHMFDIGGQLRVEPATNMGAGSYRYLVFAEYFRLLVFADLTLYRLSGGTERLWDADVLQGALTTAWAAHRAGDQWARDLQQALDRASGGATVTWATFVVDPYRTQWSTGTPSATAPTREQYVLLRILCESFWKASPFWNPTRLVNPDADARVRDTKVQVWEHGAWVPLGFGYGMINDKELVATATAAFFDGVDLHHSDPTYATTHVKNLWIHSAKAPAAGASGSPGAAMDVNREDLEEIPWIPETWARSAVDSTAVWNATHAMNPTDPFEFRYVGFETYAVPLRMNCRTHLSTHFPFMHRALTDTYASRADEWVGRGYVFEGGLGVVMFWRGTSYPRLPLARLGGYWGPGIFSVVLL